MTLKGKTKIKLESSRNLIFFSKEFAWFLNTIIYPTEVRVTYLKS